jgi:hypothetical protein
MSAKCWASESGYHDWEDIIFYIEGMNVINATTQLGYDGVRCKSCGVTSWRGWDGIIAVERER